MGLHRASTTAPASARGGPDETDALRAAAGTLAAAINRERSERRLREADARFRSIVETTPAITYQEHETKGYDVEGSVLYVSPQVERISGTPPAIMEIPGFWANLLHPDDREAVIRERDPHGRAVSAGVPDDRRGRVVWFRDESVLIHDEQGEPCRQGVMVDVKERKEAEAQPCARPRSCSGRSSSTCRYRHAR